MPQITETQLARLGSAVNSRDAMISRLKEQAKAKDVQNNAMALATAGAGAAAFGFLRGKMEDKTTGAWNVPGLNVDVEAVAILAIGALALGGGMIDKSLKKFEGHATHVCAGILGHYVGQLARKMAHTGKFSLVAGNPQMYLPPPGSGVDTPGYLGGQLGAPFSDPSAYAMSEGGV